MLTQRRVVARTGGLQAKKVQQLTIVADDRDGPFKQAGRGVGRAHHLAHGTLPLAQPIAGAAQSCPGQRDQLPAGLAPPALLLATAAYGDDGPWYIPLARSYAEGGYEPSVSFVSPTTEPGYRAAIRALLGA